MKIKYLATFAAISLLSIGVASAYSSSSATTLGTTKVAVCAGKTNPCAGKTNPCAGKTNPCAGKTNPCAAKTNPCAGKTNPCAAKTNPCAGKTNPCAGKTSKVTRNSAIYTENGLALDGQDVVSYFTEGKPVTGKKQFTYGWKGANWQFSSAANRDLFAKNPEKYAPAYGGYCAKAASDGNLATTVPTAWEIRNGKLYLNYSAEAQQEWLQGTSQLIVKADRNYPKILNNETLFR